MLTSPFLSNLGVPQIAQARSPTIEGMPKALNPNNKSQWESAIRFVIPSGNPFEDWGLTLRKYVELCERSSLFPFDNAAIDHNEQIEWLLYESRRRLVQFVKRFNLFKNMTVRKVYHDVDVHDSGCVLTVYAKVRNPDPTFIRWIQGLPNPYRFPVLHDKKYKYRKSITSNLDIWVQSIFPTNPEHWYVGYDVKIPYFPRIPNNDLPSKAEIAKFVIEILWIPMIKNLRLIQHRLL